MYKSAMLGCGGRARGHADAYRFVKRGKLAAICDMHQERLNNFGGEYGISSRYTDLNEMLQKENPDVLHIVTSPVVPGSNERIRYPLMKQASNHGVPAAVVEKPVAIEGEDWKQIDRVSRRDKNEICCQYTTRFPSDQSGVKKRCRRGTYRRD